MPRLSVWLIRVSLLALLLGATLGAWRLALGGPADITRQHLRALHRLLLLDGWLIPFVIGTAHWMLPKHAGEHPRGDPRVGVAGLILFLAGLLGGGITIMNPTTPWASVLATGIRLLGFGCWLTMLWPRVKPFGFGRNTPASSAPLP
ncbi:MAG: hypothetical protein ABI587_17290 [Gemmatimonadales bacterium]